MAILEKSGYDLGYPLTHTRFFMLNDTQIRKAKPKEKPYKLTDSNGLYIVINPNGSKLWRYRFRIDGKESVFSIGAYPEVSLAEAREKRKEARLLVQQGINPAKDRADKKYAPKQKHVSSDCRRILHNQDDQQRQYQGSTKYA